MRNRALENVAYILLTTISSDLFVCSDLKLLVVQTEPLQLAKKILELA
jgi:hypothetical protein